MTDLEHCHAAALRFLQYRWNSAVELRRKLRRKQFSDEVITSTLDRLRAEKWLDDERFAAAVVRTRSRKRIGRLRIQSELGAAGVDDETIARAIAGNIDDDSERAALEALCRKKIRLLELRGGSGFAATGEGRNKLTSYLLKQGYDAALVEQVVRETLRAGDR
jgi:regulatory protein